MVHASRGFAFGWPARDSVDACRRRVKALEYRADIAELPACFEFLGRAAYESRDMQRLLDSAVALIAAAQRSGDAAARQEGLRRQAIAAQLLGDVWQSIDAMQSLLAAEPRVDPAVQAALRARYQHRVSRAWAMATVCPERWMSRCMRCI